MRSLTITELEQACGVSRSTIYYYVREGLLPTAQKAAASRAVYAESHVELLREIRRLKEQGMGLRDIKGTLAPKVASACAMDVDLVAEQAGQTRQAILAAAARMFVRKGYKRTRIIDIIKEAGVTPPVFYSHFPSKQDLFVEAFGVFVGWMRDDIEGRLASEPDPAARDLARVRGYLGVQALSPDLLGLVRSEGLHEDGDMRRVVQKSATYDPGTLEARSPLGALGCGLHVARRGARRTVVDATDEQTRLGASWRLLRASYWFLPTPTVARGVRFSGRS